MKSPIAVYLLFVLFILSFTIADTLDDFRTVPKPSSIESIKSAGVTLNDLTGVFTINCQRPVMYGLLDTLPAADKSAPGVVTLNLVSNEIPAQGYQLKIANSKVDITASSPSGLFYACQTLTQMIEDADDIGKPIPACIINDAPALKYRAVHFDVKHHLDTMKYYYDAIDRLARYKVNAIIFELEDKLRYRRQPLVGCTNAMSIEQVAALTKYAAERHIEISPLVQGLGHASFILKHDVYKPLRENPASDWTFCPLNEDTYKVQFDLYKDAIEATPGAKYLHVGGDEVSGLGRCDKCKKSGKDRLHHRVF